MIFFSLKNKDINSTTAATDKNILDVTISKRKPFKNAGIISPKLSSAQ
jgi:hypothetical protein